jgi:serine/threonine protein kinase
METFLLKIFRISHGTGPGTSYDGFSRLAHPHLVTHLGGWSMENELFLVFPTPALTLYDLLRTSGHAYITEKGLNNILGQLAGIGSAIAYLSKLQPIRKGFHHDIRSDDILLFPIEGQEDHLYVWKLGSFGTNREMFNFMEGPKRNSKRYRLRSYMSLRSYYETDYPTGLDSGKSDVRSFGGICREVWVWLDGLKRGKSADPIESWKPGMPSVENGNGGEERIAEIARKCLTVDQEARISPSALVLEFDAFLSPSDTFDHRDANPVDTHEAISLPESPSLAPLDVFSKMSSLSSAEIRELNESTLLHEADRSSLDARINHIDGWAIAELGLGIEPYDLRGAAQWYRAAMLEKTAQESFVDSEDALVAGRKTLLPAKQTQVPVSAKPLETDQSRKIHHNEQAGKIAANLQTESLGPQHLGLESQAVAPDKIANASLAQGLVPWSNLSSEEQEACVGVPWRGFGIVGSSIWFEPEGLLKTLWKTRLRSEVHARIEALISTNPTFQEMFDGPRLGAYSLHLVVMRHPPTQQFQPTIVILSSTKKVSQRLVQALEKQQWWEQMGLSFDLIAHTGVGRLM